MDQTPNPMGHGAGGAGSSGPGGPRTRPVKTAAALEGPPPLPANQPAAGQEDALSWLGEEGVVGAKPGDRPAIPKKTGVAWLLWALGGGAAVLAMLVGIVAWFLSTGTKPAPKETPMAHQLTAKEKDEVPAKPERPAPPHEENSTLVIGWQPVDRGGGTVAIDGKDMPLPASGEVKYQLRPRAAAYRVVLTRPGYEPIEFEHSAQPGEPPEPFQPDWKRRGQDLPRIAAVDPSVPPPPKIEERPVPPPVERTEPVAKDVPEPAKTSEGALTAPPPKRPDGVKPEEFLKRCGLARAGDLWLLPGEKAVQQKVGQLGALKKELSRKQNVAQNAEKQFQAAEKTYREVKLQFDALRRRFEASVVISTSELAMLNAAKSRYDEAKNAADQARRAADEARAAANSTGEALAAEVTKLAERFDRTNREYAALADTPAIRQSIADYNAEAEKESVLGPAESFRGLSRRIDEWKSMVAAMSEKVPARQRGQLWYVEVELNGKKKLEMAIDTGAEILCLPWKAAREAGLDPERGQPVLVQVADGSTARAVRLTAPVVQVGRFTARNVECTVLPAEAGDIVPLLGQTFLSRFSYRIDAAERALVLSGGSAAEKPSDSRGRK